jgi:hypothetical protein
MAKYALSCPVCHRKAKLSASTAGDYSEITCSDCGHFQISATLKQIFASYPMSIRRLALARAQLRARYGVLPLITTYDLP